MEGRGEQGWKAFPCRGVKLPWSWWGGLELGGLQLCLVGRAELEFLAQREQLESGFAQGSQSFHPPSCPNSLSPILLYLRWFDSQPTSWILQVGVMPLTVPRLSGCSGSPQGGEAFGMVPSRNHTLANGLGKQHGQWNESWGSEQG